MFRFCIRRVIQSYQPYSGVIRITNYKSHLVKKSFLCRRLNFNTYKGIFLCSSLLTWLGFQKEDENKESELIMTIKRSILCMQRQELPKAEQMLHVALKLAQEQQNHQGITYVYDLMANLAMEREETEKAEKLFLLVLQRILSNNVPQDDIKVVHISLKLSRIYQMQGADEKAEIGYQWCLNTIQNHIKNEQNEALILCGAIHDWYAKYLLEKRRYDECKKHLLEAHKICSQAEGVDSEKSILLLNDLGTASFQSGQLQEAQDYLKDALTLSKIAKDFQYQAVIYANLGLVHLSQGSISQAKKYCNQSWRIAIKQNNFDIKQQAEYCIQQINQHDK